MSKEFTVSDVEWDSIVESIAEAGVNDKGEKFVLYPASIHHEGVVVKQNFGGRIRLENEAGNGYDVGVVHPPLGSFGRGSLVLTSFNSCPTLLGRVLSILAIKRW